MRYPLLGVSKETYDFEEKYRNAIVSWDTEVTFYLEEKMVVFTLVDKRKVYFIFPFTKIITWKESQSI